MVKIADLEKAQALSARLKIVKQALTSLTVGKANTNAPVQINGVRAATIYEDDINLPAGLVMDYLIFRDALDREQSALLAELAELGVQI